MLAFAVAHAIQRNGTIDSDTLALRPERPAAVSILSTPAGHVVPKHRQDGDVNAIVNDTPSTLVAGGPPSVLVFGQASSQLGQRQPTTPSSTHNLDGR